MILQKDDRLRPKIQKYGCYFMSILFHVNRLTGRGFNTSDINELYDTIPDIWMERDCFIGSPYSVARFLKLDVVDVRFESPKYKCKPNEFEILCYKRKNYKHFVCGNGEGIVTYDPSGISNAVKYGTLDSKRIFVL